VCAALCHIIAHELKLRRPSATAWCRGHDHEHPMTALQDELAEQAAAPRTSSRATSTPTRSRAACCWRVGIVDELWLAVVASHHENLPLPLPGSCPIRCCA
jgi:hypothetical protein